MEIPLENCGNFNFPVRYFPKHRQDILESMVNFRRTLNPSLVLVPNSHDIHQDHEVICNEARRAFKHTNILGYELPWNTMSMEHEFFVHLGRDDVDKKLSSLACYRSQEVKIYANHDFFNSLSIVRGVQANTKYAECFEVIRLHFFE